MKKYLSVFFILQLIVLTSCTTDADDEWSAAEVCPESKRGTFVDERDGQLYKYTTIGKQVWMAQNLNYNAEGSQCYYGDDVCVNIGRLYMLENAACPNGWHLPSKNEWTALVNKVGGLDEAALHLKNESGWKPLNPDDNGNGLNDCGFSMLPFYRMSEKDGFVATFLTSTLDSSVSYGGIPANVFIVVAASYMNEIEIASNDRDYYANVRCIKD